MTFCGFLDRSHSRHGHSCFIVSWENKMKTVTLFGSIYPVSGLVSLICSTVFFFTLSGGQTSRDMHFQADIVKVLHFCILILCCK